MHGFNKCLIYEHILSFTGEENDEKKTWLTMCPFFVIIVSLMYRTIAMGIKLERLAMNTVL